MAGVEHLPPPPSPMLRAAPSSAAAAAPSSPLVRSLCVEDAFADMHAGAEEVEGGSQVTNAHILAAPSAGHAARSPLASPSLERRAINGAAARPAHSPAASPGTRRRQLAKGGSSTAVKSKKAARDAPAASPPGGERGPQDEEEEAEEEDDDDEEAEAAALTATYNDLAGPVAEFRRSGSAAPAHATGKDARRLPEPARSGSLTAAMAQRLSDTMRVQLGQEPGAWDDDETVSEDEEGEDVAGDGDGDGDEGALAVEGRGDATGGNGRATRASPTAAQGEIALAWLFGVRRCTVSALTRLPSLTLAAQKGRAAAAATFKRRHGAAEPKQEVSTGDGPHEGEENHADLDPEGEEAALPVVGSPRLPVRRKHAHPDVHRLLRLNSTVSYA